MPPHRNSGRQVINSREYIFRTGAVLVTAMAGYLAATILVHQAEKFVYAVSYRFPTDFQQYPEGTGEVLEWAPGFGEGHFSESRIATSNGFTSNVQVITYVTGLGEGELIRYDHSIADGIVWRREQAPTTIEANEAGRQFDVNEAVLSREKSRKRIAVIYWYDVGGLVTTSPLLAKAYNAIGTVMGRPDSSIVAFSSTCDMDCAKELANLHELVATVVFDVDGEYLSPIVLSRER